MHQDELWQEYDYRGTRIMNGGMPVDPETSNLFSGVSVMLYRWNNNKVEYLFQHRSKKIIGNPDKWDTSFGGHINYQEPTLDAAVREGKEEINANIDINKIEFAAKYFGRIDCIINLFFYDYTSTKENFKFNDEEVEEVKWVPFDEYKDFIKSGPIKTILANDMIFEHFLGLWAKKIESKYNGNH